MKLNLNHTCFPRWFNKTRFISKFLIFLVAFFFRLNSFGQFYTTVDKNFLFEAGVGVGVMGCVTDLGGPKGRGGYYLNEVNWSNAQLSGSIYVDMLYKHIIGVRLEATAGRVMAYDSILKGIATEKAIGRFQRNLSFRSPIRELTLLAEFHPLMLRTYDTYLPRISPYIVAGVSVFSFNPEAFYNGGWVPLQPLRTEGQGFAEYPDRKPYSLTQLNFTGGGGIRFEMDQYNIRIELINRVLFTDYLDDVSTDYIDPSLFDKYLSSSQAEKARALYKKSIGASGSDFTRGNSKNDDAYLSINVKAGFKLGKDGLHIGKKKSAVGCFSW